METIGAIAVASEDPENVVLLVGNVELVELCLNQFEKPVARVMDVEHGFPVRIFEPGLFDLFG